MKKLFEPLFTNRVEDKELLLKYLNKCTNYFEFGMGGSTTIAGNNKNIEKIYSVDNDLDWYKKIKKCFPEERIGNNVFLFYINIKTTPHHFGIPSDDSNPDNYKNYSNAIFNLTKEDQQKIDLVFIDGRFRVACALKCFNVINDDCFVIVDDFSRKQYWQILKYYEVVENSSNKCMAVLKKRKNCIPPTKEIIKKYEFIYN
mgnify:CR=1 FL=1|tara:strand:- start:315 stop:917 length:603 start_codon:yes stop_codon:yes gene_type:complete